jgi:O-antigen/teichoic acid export membrane protein
MAFNGLFSLVGKMGFASAHIKRVSEGKDLGTCIGTFATIKIALTFIMIAIVLSAIFIMKYVLKTGFQDATTETAVYVFLIYTSLLNVVDIAVYTFQGKKEIAKMQLTILFENVIKVPLMIVVALAGATIAGVVSISPAIDWPGFLQPLQKFISTHAIGSLAAAYIFGVLASVFVGLWLLKKYPIKKPTREFFKSYFVFAMPIMILALVNNISLNVDKVMIGYFWTSVEVGYYFTMQQVFELVIILSTSVGIVLFPTISEYHAKKNYAKMKQLTRLAERYISMIIIPVIVVIIIFASSVINILFDSSFLPAVPVLMTLTLYAFLVGLKMPYSSLIQGMNKPAIAAKVGLLMGISNIVLNFLFIPENGLLSNVTILGSTYSINGPTGAAFATSLSVLIGFIGLRLAAKKHLKIKLIQSHTPRHLLAGAVMGAILYYIAYQTSLFPVIRWFHLLGFAGLGLAIYLGILFVLREFDKKDMKFFLELIRPKEMLKYVSSEIRDKPKKPQ